MEFAFWVTTSHPSRLTPLPTSLQQYSSLWLSQCKLLPHYYDHVLYTHTHMMLSVKAHWYQAKNFEALPTQRTQNLTWGINNLLKSLEYPKGYGCQLDFISFQSLFRLPWITKPFCFFMQHKSLGVACFMEI